MRALSVLPSRGQWVDAAPFRAHVRHAVSVTGVPWQALAVVAGVPLAAVRGLLFGRAGRLATRLEPRLASRLLGVDAAELTALRQLWVGATVTAEALWEVLGAGVDPLALARWCQLTPDALAGLVDGDSTRCTRLTEALAVAAERDLGSGTPALRPATLLAG